MLYVWLFRRIWIKISCSSCNRRLIWCLLMNQVNCRRFSKKHDDFDYCRWVLISTSKVLTRCNALKWFQAVLDLDFSKQIKFHYWTFAMIQMKFKYVSKKKLLQSRQFISYDKYEVYIRESDEIWRQKSHEMFTFWHFVNIFKFRIIFFMIQAREWMLCEMK